MNIISCDSCGVLMDKDKLVFPDFRDEDGAVIEGLADWNGDRWVSAVECPVCENYIREYA